MDIAKLIHKFRTINLEEEYKDIISFVSRMKLEKEKISTRCLIRKAL